MKNYFTVAEMCTMLPLNLEYKFTIDEHPLLHWIFDEVVALLKSAPDGPSIEERLDFQEFFDKFFLKYAWGYKNFESLLDLGYCSQKMFVFALGECGSIQNLITILSKGELTTAENLSQIYSKLASCNIVFS